MLVKILICNYFRKTYFCYMCVCERERAVEQLGRFHLVRNLILEKIPNKTGIIKIAKSSWCIDGTFYVASWGDNVYVFNFELEKDCTKILQSSPWAFMGIIMVLQRMNPAVTLKEMNFKTCMF